MGHLLASGWFVFLIVFAKLEAQKNPPPSFDSKCLGNILLVNVGPLGGRHLEVAAVHNGSSVVLTQRIASQCGFRMKTSPPGNAALLVSLQNCFAQNVDDVDFTTTLNLRLHGDQMVEEQVHQVEETCRYAPWASREIICDSGYMEVSVRRPASDDYAVPQKSIPRSKMGRSTEKSEGDAGFRVKRLAFFTPEEKTMEVNDAQRAYMITNTATRLLLRSPPASSETFTQDVSGVTMTVLKTSVMFENKWMATRLNVVVACPTLEGEEEEEDDHTGSVIFVENAIRWFLPLYIDPLVSGQFQLLEVHMGIDGSRLDPAEAAARGYSLTVGEVYVVLEIPFGATGGHVKSYVQDNRYYTSYEIEPMLELRWAEDMREDTRYKVLLPITRPPWLHSVYVANNTVPEKLYFDFQLGSFGLDVLLMNLSLPTGVLSVDECIARGFNIVEHTLSGGSLKFFTLQVPFSDPSVQQRSEAEMIVFSLHVTFGLLVVPEFTQFFHTASLEAKVTSTVSPSISGGCDNDNFYVLVKYGTQGFNFVPKVGKQRITPLQAAEYALMENGTHLSFVVPVTSVNVVYEAVQATSIRARLDVMLLDPETNENVAEFSLSCTVFTTLTECFPNGTITTTAMKLESVPSLNPSQLVLRDPSCGPVASDNRSAYFVFSGSSCGTTRRFFDNMMLYENEISLPDELQLTKSEEEPEYELKVYCYYDVNATHAVSFNTRARRSEPYAEDARGELQAEIRVASDNTYTRFHSAADHPVAKYLQEPVYFEVELKGTKLADVSLELDSCWATLDSNRLSQPRWNLVINGCANPVDPYQVIFHPVWVDERVRYPSHFKRFEVQMFAFATDDDDLSRQVFVHCDVVICDAKKPQDEVCDRLCSKKDIGNKGQRRAVPDDHRPLHVLAGPILITE